MSNPPITEGRKNGRFPASQAPDMPFCFRPVHANIGVLAILVSALKQTRRKLPQADIAPLILPHRHVGIGHFPCAVRVGLGFWNDLVLGDLDACETLLI